MAELYFDLALQKDPKNPGLWLKEARAAELDKDWRRARQGYDRALALNGSLAEAWLGIGNVSIATGRYDRALQGFMNASRLGRSDAARAGEFRAFLAAGQAFLQQGKFDEALRYYDLILVNNSSDPGKRRQVSRPGGPGTIAAAAPGETTPRPGRSSKRRTCSIPRMERQSKAWPRL